MKRVFTHLFDRFDRHRKLLVTVLTICMIAFAAGALRLRFDEDISGFLPSDPKQEQVNWAYKHIGVANKIVVNFTMADTTQTDTERLIEAVDGFVDIARDNGIDHHVKSILYTVDQNQIVELSKFVSRNMPYFLTEEDYEQMEQRCSSEAIESALDGVKSMLFSPIGGVLKQTLTTDPMMFSGNLLQQLQGFRLNDSFEVIDDYIFSDSGRSATVVIDSKYPVSETANGKLLIEIIDRAAEECCEEMNGEVKIVPFGSSYIAQTNSSQIKRDSIISIVVALILIGALLFYFFGNLRNIMLIALSILFGALFALFFMSVFTHSISLIAVGAGSIIIGIAINYPLHFITHIRDGYSPRTTVADIVPPLTTGNITTVSAFLSLLFITSPAMHDLGLFASLLLVGTILFVLIFLSHIVKPTTSLKVRTRNFGKIADSAPEKSRWVIGGVIAITVFLWFFGGKVQFQSDMQAINYMTDEQRTMFSKMLAQTQGAEHIAYFAVRGNDVDQALERYEEVVPKLDKVIESDSALLGKAGIGVFMPSKAMQQKRLEMWREFWNRHPDFAQTFDRKAAEAGFTPEAFSGFTEIINNNYQPHGIEYFAPIMQNMASNYIVDEQDGAMVLTVVHALPEKAEEVEERLNSVDDKAFAFDTGSLTRMMVDTLSKDFDFVLYVCGFIVLLFLTISFGRIELSLLSFLPLVVGWIWILGIMGLCGMQFNIVNIILATFIFGMGDDYTIFVTEGLMYEYAYRRKMLSTYKNTVTLSALIMFIGIGSLIIARHPAMRSLAEVTMVGMFSVVLMAYIIPPLVFRYLTTKHARPRQEPITLANLSATAFSFLVMMIGSLVVSIVGFVLLTLGGHSEKHKLKYHKFLQTISRWVMFRVPFTKTTIANPTGERFDKQAVIISNHQAHLDLMAMIMLTPKLVIITNKWVWHSPFYGAVIRYADFCPIDNMFEDDLSRLEERIKQGYSVMIFPEGTRSEDCSIGRFHKGAFYLAERYGLDIVPVLLHGFGHVLPKTDLLLRKGEMTVKILGRIKADDKNCGDGYSERTKTIKRMYDKEYECLARQTETVDYFAGRIVHNYTYKGIDVERTVKRVLKQNDNYKELIASLPDTGTVAIIEPRYGAAAMLASLVRRRLRIDAIISNDDERTLAEWCIDKGENINYMKEQDELKSYDKTIDLR